MLTGFRNFLAITAVITAISTIPAFASDGTKRVDMPGVYDVGVPMEEVLTPEELAELDAQNKAFADQIQKEYEEKHKEAWALRENNKYGTTASDMFKESGNLHKIGNLPDDWYINPEKYMPVEVLSSEKWSKPSGLGSLALMLNKPRNLDRTHMFRIDEGFRQYTIVTDLNPEYFYNVRGWLETYAAYVYSAEADYLKRTFNVMEMPEEERMRFIIRYYGNKYHYGNALGGDELSIGGYSTGRWSCVEYTNFILNIVTECGFKDTGVLSVSTKDLPHAILYANIGGKMKYINPTWLLGGNDFANAIADSPDEAVDWVRYPDFKASLVNTDITMRRWGTNSDSVTWEMID